MFLLASFDTTCYFGLCTKIIEFTEPHRIREKIKESLNIEGETHMEQFAKLQVVIFFFTTL